MILGLALFAVGILLSAFFSGSETGFYRVTRVRLLLDGLTGDPISRALLWLTNNPALFVATTLIGNNLANYLASLAIVMITQSLLATPGLVVEVMAPVLFSPVVFVYGELLPKNLFYLAPNRLLRRGGWFFLLCAVLFAPLSGLLWLLGRLLEAIVGEGPLKLQLTLARKELQGVLEEGHEAGILHPAQRDLAQSLFTVASRPVSELSTPLGRVATVKRGASKQDVLRVARRHRATAAPVVDEKGRDLVGYVRIVDLYLDDSTTVSEYRPLPRVLATSPHIAALIQLQTSKDELAEVIDGEGQTVGLLYANELTDPLFRDG